MKKLSKKGVLLFAAAMALCAFAMPSMAGAASWTVVGSEHTLDSPNVGFTSTGALGSVTSSCTSSSFTTTVSNSTTLEITAARFGGHCTAVGPGIGTCTTDATANALPWTATALATTNVQLHGVDITVVFTQNPSGSGCAVPGLDLRITGTINSGSVWDEARRELVLTNAEGLSSHIAGQPTVPVTARGTFRDTQQSLTMHD